MRKSRFTDEQIIAILRESAAGGKTGELIRRHGISRETFYKWRRKYGDLQLDEAKRLRALEEENRRLKRVVADQALNIQVLKGSAMAEPCACSRWSTIAHGNHRSPWCITRSAPCGSPKFLDALPALPTTLVCDNGPEFTSQHLDQWAHDHGITLQFIRPGKPIENCFIERFNGRLRDECLNESGFVDLADAQRTVEAWRVAYNTARPHSALDNHTHPSLPRASRR